MLNRAGSTECGGDGDWLQLRRIGVILTTDRVKNDWKTWT